MARAFHSATAEQVTAAVAAVVSVDHPVDKEFVAAFTELSETSAESALLLAADLGLLAVNAQNFERHSPLCGFATIPNVKVRAALLRTVLEAYEPFTVFRRQLVATDQAQAAATQTKAILDLDAHRDDISQTLIDLGTFAQAITSEGGGRHVPAESPLESHLVRLAQAATDLASAEQSVRGHLGTEVADLCSTDDVIIPLAQALLNAASATPQGSAGAVTLAGNAVESYLSAMAVRLGVNLNNAHGIASKVDRIATAGSMPSKLKAIGKYLGSVRNAADHGVDPETGAAWVIRAHTGHEFTSVAMSYIGACHAQEFGAGNFI